jgi:glutamyl-tRNA reductase
VTVLALGLDFRTAPLDLRSRFALPSDSLPQALRSLARRLPGATEAAIVATCNRTELYLDGPDGAADGALDWLAEHGGASRSALAGHTYVHEADGAARHAFRVASGLESMVLGEPQILGQFKRAAREAEGVGTLGATLHQLFQRSFATAKEVRTHTGIGARPVTFSSAAVYLAARLFEDLAGARVLCLGAGEMIELAAISFAARRPKSITIASRRRERAQPLLDRVGAGWVPIAEAIEGLAAYDIVVSCTASPVPIIGLGAVTRALRARRGVPMLVVDLAVPRDVEAEVGALDDVFLHTLDDLAAVVRSGDDHRRDAVRDAESIVEQGVRGFVDWLDHRGAVPLIRAMHERADQWRCAELARARRLLARGADIEQVLDAMSRGLAAKMLHGPLAELKACEPTRRAEVGRTLQRLFLERG